MKRKCLIVVEKPSILNMVKKVYEELGAAADFVADFAVINCHVENLKTTKIPANELSDFTPLTLQKSKVSSEYIIHADNDMMLKRGEAIVKMVRENNYDVIVNACDPDDCGELSFKYMLESLNLTRRHTEQIFLFDLTDSLIESELLTLNEF